MRKYGNGTGQSTITHYEIGNEFIRVQFKNELLEYDALTHTKEHVDKMKRLAMIGEGLSRYITQHVQQGRCIHTKTPTKLQTLKEMFRVLLK